MFFVFVCPVNIVPEIGRICQSVMDTAKINDHLFSIQNYPEIIIPGKRIVQLPDIISKCKGYVIADSKIKIIISKWQEIRPCSCCHIVLFV